MRKAFIVTLGLMSLGAFAHATPAFAAPKVCKQASSCVCSGTKPGQDSSNCIKCQRLTTQCINQSEAQYQKNKNRYGRDGSPFQPGRGTKIDSKGNRVPTGEGTGKSTKKGGPGTGVIADDPNRGWNGKYTAFVVTDATGTKTISVKQGVPTEGVGKILGPDGHRYDAWDPRLGALLEAKHVVDGQGRPVAYANEKAARNEYAVQRDKEIRGKAAEKIARGDKTVVLPPPTGTRNKDALGNKAPVVRDQRADKSKPAATSTLPPAATPGTVSTTPVTNPAAQGGVRDHRKGGNAANNQGGITVTKSTPARTNGGSPRPSGSKDTQRK